MSEYFGVNNGESGDLSAREILMQQTINQYRKEFLLIEAESIWNYFQDGKTLPRLNKNGSETGSDTSNNFSPIKDLISQPLGIIDIDENSLQHCKRNKTKVFSLEHDDHIYTTEPGVHSYCTLVLDDMLIATGLSKELRITRELRVDKSKPDVWVLTRHGIPVGVMVIKKPVEDKILIDRNFGQLFDYMMRLRSFYGLRYCFGILTSFDQWFICWFPDSDNYAASKVVEYEEQETDQLNRTTASDRHLSYVQYSGKSSNEVKPLATALCTVLHKMAWSAKVAPERISLLKSDRFYIKMNSKGWYWAPRSRITAKQLTLTPPPTDTSDFFMLFDLRGGAEGKTWVACSSHGHLAVIKLYHKRDHPLEALVKERDRWRKCGLHSVFLTHLCEKPAIVMPVGFTFPRKKLDMAWTIGSENLIEGFEIIKGQLNLLNPELVLSECIKTFADKKLAHNDLSWRHVAVFFIPLGTRQNRSPAAPTDKKPTAQPSRTSSRAALIKKSIALPSRTSLRAAPTDKKSIAQPGRTSPPAAPTDKKSITQPGRTSSRAVPTDKKSIAQPSRTSSRAAPTDKKSITQPGRTSSPAAPTDKKSITLPGRTSPHGMIPQTTLTASLEALSLSSVSIPGFELVYSFIDLTNMADTNSVDEAREIMSSHRL